MEKPTLFCFALIAFIELNVTVAFLLIRKAWDDQFTDKSWGMGNFKKWGGGEGDPSNST